MQRRQFIAVFGGAVVWPLAGWPRSPKSKSNARKLLGWAHRVYIDDVHVGRG